MQKKHDSLEQAKQYALRSLTCYAQTENQIKRKLQAKAFNNEIIAETLEFLKVYHYIDDERFVEEYVATHCGRMNRKQILERLHGKGIYNASIEEYLQDADYDEEQLIQNEIAKYRRSKTVANPAQIDKMKVYFMKKGYSMSLVRACINEIE